MGAVDISLCESLLHDRRPVRMSNGLVGSRPRGAERNTVGAMSVTHGVMGAAVRRNCEEARRLLSVFDVLYALCGLEQSA